MRWDRLIQGETVVAYAMTDRVMISAYRAHCYFTARAPGTSFAVATKSSWTSVTC